VLIAPLVPVQPFMGLDHILMSFFVLVVRPRQRGGLRHRIGGDRRREQRRLGAERDSTGGYFCVLALAIVFLWLKPRGLHAR
jgi:branched-chain amino acid transport system permease protein/urea transport system permease protein